MSQILGRRQFLQAGAAIGALTVGGSRLWADEPASRPSALISPGCRRSKVRVAKVYMGIPKAKWPTPDLDLNAEVETYEREFARLSRELADVEFVGSQLVTALAQANGLAETLADVDGVLAIHLSMGVTPILRALLAAGKPTMLFAAPYSGHEWTGFGALRESKDGALFDCILSSDYDQLAVAIRPFRAIHHMREVRILNVTTRPLPEAYVQAAKEKFGTDIARIDRQPVLDAYESVSDADARAEAERWARGATQIVEPSDDEIFRSCKLALAFQNLLDAHDATAITVDCYGSMYRQLPAFPCIGHTRLDDLGFAGVCESDLTCAVTGILLQGLSGRPAFVSDPTVDESKDSIILAHCRCATKMDGPDGPSAPYKLRTIMERQEGCVAQVQMRLGQKVTQAKLIDVATLLYFTGDIADVPDVERGCRTKITVKVDGDIEKLWRNWSHGLHRQTCYGDLTRDLERWCKFMGVAMTNEA
ncbi:MAG: hypothetical protein NTW86_15805 [Candidatus Sumerlaeota bacterium]|nr:hypothetical protein [Candidatus Sumerlaeota bacterium]